MIWVFRELKRWIESETGIPVVLPGQIETPPEPTVHFVVSKISYDHADFGKIEFDEEISNGSPNADSRGNVPCVIEMTIILWAFGTSPDFADKFFHAVRRLQKLIKPNSIERVPFVATREDMNFGCGLEVVEHGTVQVEGELDGKRGVSWGSGYECRLYFPTRDDDNYTFEPPGPDVESE